MIDDGELDVLARVHGIQPHYTDASGILRVVTPETKRALLAAIGVDLGRGAAVALEEAKAAEWSTLAAPATVTQQGGPAEVMLRAVPREGAVVWTLNLESGETRRGEATWADLSFQEAAEVRGQEREARRLPLPGDLAPGYHRLTVEAGGVAEVALVVAPRQAHPPPGGGGRRPWGVAAQLYGLRGEHDWGIGDYGDLADFAAVTAGLGADAVSISPIHAMFPGDPGHFGPYGPSSRAFVNTLHIDVTAVPGFENPAIRDLVSGSGIQALIDSARRAEMVDYAAVAAAKDAVLRAIWVAEPGPYADAANESGEFGRFRAEQGDALERQATFDALHGHFFGSDPARWHWTSWPEGYRGPAAADVGAFVRDHGDSVAYFRWLQWLADRQLRAAQARARDAGMAIGLYRDLAVGTHPGGAAAWAEPDVVLTAAAIGAPPDDFNPLGQNWGLAALSPDGLRRSGYRPFIQVLRANMRHAGALRIDHVMGLERLFWVPAGASPAEGAYVTYPAAAMRGLLTLESQRQGCMVVGEDLGTVPEGFRERQAEAGVLGYRVLYFERDATGAFTDPADYPEDAVAAATTHDLPTLCGWWSGHDLDWRRKLGLFPDAAAADAAVAARTADRQALFARLTNLGLLPHGTIDAVAADALIEAVYAALARAPSRLLVVAAEDLLAEIEQPNLPGTVAQHPNWRRRLRLTMPAFAYDPLVARVAARIRDLRGSDG